jgi:hypothetical protein
MKGGKMNIRYYGAAIMMAMADSYSFFDGSVNGYNLNVLHNGVKKESHPWDNIQLSKSERRGKTYEEMQEMRKSIYENLPR